MSALDHALLKAMIMHARPCGEHACITDMLPGIKVARASCNALHWTLRRGEDAPRSISSQIQRSAADLHFCTPN